LVFIQIAAYPEYTYGDRIHISGSLKIKLPNGKNLILSLSFPKIDPAKNSNGYFLAVVNAIRQKIIISFQTK